MRMSDGRRTSRPSFGIHVHRFRSVKFAGNTQGCGTSLSWSLQVSILADVYVQTMTSSGASAGPIGVRMIKVCVACVYGTIS